MTTNGLHYDTVTPTLRKILSLLMDELLFNPFRLVGGTNLSLRLGHRKSIDIDLFTEALISVNMKFSCTTTSLITITLIPLR